MRKEISSQKAERLISHEAVRVVQDNAPFGKTLFMLSDGQVLDVHIGSTDTLAFKPDGTPVVVDAEPHIVTAWLYPSMYAYEDFIAFCETATDIDFNDVLPMGAAFPELASELSQLLPR